MIQSTTRIDTGNWLQSDDYFHKTYPTSIRLLAHKHWTPLAVARKAALFLAAENGSKILDIGSGVGKFCMAAAIIKPNSDFYGIEQRTDLIQHAESARTILEVSNVTFIQGNVIQANRNDYNHFYFYNSFYENLPGTEKIDEHVTYSMDLYKCYYSTLYRQLDKLSAGTRLATFHSPEEELPPGFHIVKTEFDTLLKFLVKE